MTDAAAAAITESGGSLVADAGDGDAIVWLSKGEPARLASLIGPQIRWVQLVDAGVDAWQGSGVLEADAQITSARGCCAAAVAEHALTLMLAGARQLPA